VLEARIAALRKEFEVDDEEAATLRAEEVSRKEIIAESRDTMARSRRADQAPEFNHSKKGIKGRNEKISKR
jgi:hypothetical protein